MISPGVTIHLLARVRILALAAVFSAGLHGQDAPAAGTLTYAEGRVMVRSAAGARIEFPKVGRMVSAGEALVTGEESRVELRMGEAGLWRVGRRAVFLPEASGGRLMAGTALVRVPVEAGWRVAGARGSALLGKGLWMLQAVDNEGLKLMCLDGPAVITALGDGALPAAGEAPARMKLHPGELVFLRPGGKEFGPIVTIYLEELLATSRLVNAFPTPLAEARRLQRLGVAQREQLKGVTNALVAGARDENGFEIVMPKAK